ncbi:MAG: SPOR domain-containing protein [Bacteroidales bacterium]|nr:SPOR domain-containing protein [Bacteroidales bacterium]
MKLLKIFILGLFVVFLSDAAQSQVVTYSAAKSLLNTEQIKVLAKAEKYIDKAEAKISKAEAIEKKYEKKKRKKKKYNKKTWEAKKFRIQAEKDYLRAYQDASSVYSQIIVGATYYDDSDKSEAHKLNDDAVSLIESADKKMSKYNKKIGDKKYLKKLSYSSVTGAASSARSSKENAYSKQTEALDIVLNQGKKKEASEKDNKAWANAQNINTITSYQDYIDNFPSGKFISRARQMIRQLQAEQKKKKPVVSNYVFKVQIAASRNPVSKYELAGKYSNTSEIEKEYSGGFYKYRVKSFPTYSQAAAFRDQLLNSTVPDAFVVAYDKNGNQVEVTDEMKTH